MIYLTSNNLSTKSLFLFTTLFHSYLILMIYAQFQVINNNHFFEYSYMVSSNPNKYYVFRPIYLTYKWETNKYYHSNA